MPDYSIFKPLFISGICLLAAGLTGIYLFSGGMRMAHAVIIMLLMSVGATLFGFSFFFLPDHKNHLRVGRKPHHEDFWDGLMRFSQEEHEKNQDVV